MKDLIILGNGMAGMTAALYASRANLDFKIVGRDEYNFGQISNAILVENFPCMEPMSGFDLAMKLHDQLEANGIKIEEHEVVRVLREIGKSITKGDTSYYYKIEYADGTSDEAKTVIYALGAKHRELNCKIAEDVQIHYCALCDGALYKDKTVAIIGGGDVAFTQAEYLSKICKNVRIIMCDHNITAAPATFERVSKIKNIDITYDFIVNEIAINRYPIIGEEQYKIVISRKAPDDGKARLLGISVDGVFVAIGMIPNTTPIDIYNVVNKDGYISALDTGISMLNPGFFAAGDVRTKMTRQALTAASDGANAVQSAIQYLKER
jgi:thioredoxin reductase (NADPH)